MSNPAADIYRVALVELDRMRADCVAASIECMTVAVTIDTYRSELQKALHALEVSS